MAQYESDLTKFMRQYLEQHPEELASQQKGRADWWDKDPDAAHPAAAAAPPCPVRRRRVHLQAADRSGQAE